MVYMGISKVTKSSRFDCSLDAVELANQMLDMYDWGGLQKFQADRTERVWRDRGGNIWKEGWTSHVDSLLVEDAFD